MIKLNFYSDLYDISLCEPKMIKAKVNPTDLEYHYFTLNRETYLNLYKLIGVKFNESKVLFNANETYWNDYISKNMETNKFKFEDYSFIIAGDELMVSMFNKMINVDELKRSYNKLTTDLSEISENLIEQTFDLDTYVEKIIINSSKCDDFDNVVMIENDYLNSQYSIISGIKINKMIWPHSSKSLSEKNILQFLIKVNLEDEVNLSTKFGGAIYKDFYMI